MVLGLFRQGFSQGRNTLGDVLYKARLWKRINQKPVNERRHLIINRMLEDNFKEYEYNTPSW